jgi:hypothetical protein
MNHNNRPQISKAVSTAADKKIPLVHAHKKMRVLGAKLVSVGAIAASGSAYAALKLQKSLTGVAPADVSGNPAVDTQAGVAAYGVLALDTDPEIVLEKGETLYLDVDITGSLTLDAHLDLDLEVVGN